MSVSKIVPYLEGRIKKSLDVDVKDVAHFHSRRAKSGRGGFFGIPRTVFCYVEFLGKLANNSRSQTENAEFFLKKYFPAHYRDYAELVYAMCRHGTVHEIVPKMLYSDSTSRRPKRIRLEWQINNDNSRKERNKNLQFVRVVGKKATLRLVLNTCQLADDLILAFNSFFADLKRDRHFRGQCQRRLTEVLRIKDIDRSDTIQRSASRNAASRELLLAWSNPAGKADRRGRLLNRT